MIYHLLTHLGANRRTTLTNLADVLLLEGPERSRFFEDGLAGVARWIRMLCQIDGCLRLPDYVEQEPTGDNRFLAAHADRLRELIDSNGFNSDGYCRLVILENVLAFCRVPKPLEVRGEFGILSAVYKRVIRETKILPQIKGHAGGRATLTHGGLMELSKLRRGILSPDFPEQHDEYTATRLTPEPPSAVLPRPTPIDGFPPEIVWFYLNRDHGRRCDPDAWMKPIPEADKERRRDFKKHLVFAVRIVACLGPRAKVFEKRYSNGWFHLLALVDERFVISMKLSHKMQTEWKPEMAIDLASGEGASRMVDCHGDLSGFVRRTDIEEPYLSMPLAERAVLARQIKGAGFALAPELDCHHPPVAKKDAPHFEEPVRDPERHVDWSAFPQPVKPNFVISWPPHPDQEIPRRGMIAAQVED